MSNSYQSLINIIRKSFNQLRDHFVGGSWKYVVNSLRSVELAAQHHIPDFQEYILILKGKIDNIGIIITDEKDNYAIDKTAIHLYARLRLSDMVYVALNLLAKCAYPRFGPDEELMEWTKFIMDIATVLKII